MDAMYFLQDGSDTAVNAVLEMQSQVDAETDLDEELEVEDVGECGMHVGWQELPSAVLVGKDEAKDREECSKDLNWDVPA
jgi:hypothetical protein